VVGSDGENGRVFRLRVRGGRRGRLRAEKGWRCRRGTLYSQRQRAKKDDKRMQG